MRQAFLVAISCAVIVLVGCAEQVHRAEFDRIEGQNKFVHSLDEWEGWLRDADTPKHLADAPEAEFEDYMRLILFGESASYLDSDVRARMRAVVEKARTLRSEGLARRAATTRPTPSIQVSPQR